MRPLPPAPSTSSAIARPHPPSRPSSLPPAQPSRPPALLPSRLPALVPSLLCPLPRSLYLPCSPHPLALLIPFPGPAFLSPAPSPSRRSDATADIDTSASLQAARRGRQCSAGDTSIIIRLASAKTAAACTANLDILTVRFSHISRVFVFHAYFSRISPSPVPPCGHARAVVIFKSVWCAWLFMLFMLAIRSQSDGGRLALPGTRTHHASPTRPSGSIRTSSGCTMSTGVRDRLLLWLLCCFVVFLSVVVFLLCCGA